MIITSTEKNAFVMICISFAYYTLTISQNHDNPHRNMSVFQDVLGNQCTSCSGSLNALLLVATLTFTIFVLYKGWSLLTMSDTDDFTWLGESQMSSTCD